MSTKRKMSVFTICVVRQSSSMMATRSDGNHKTRICDRYNIVQSILAMFRFVSWHIIKIYTNNIILITVAKYTTEINSIDTYKSCTINAKRKSK